MQDTFTVHLEDTRQILDKKYSEDAVYKTEFSRYFLKILLEDTFIFTCTFVCLCILHITVSKLPIFIH